jgi:hypothetical protein
MGTRVYAKLVTVTEFIIVNFATEETSSDNVDITRALGPVPVYQTPANEMYGLT